MTDADFLLEVLSDGARHDHAEILRRSFAERGCGLTIHSRAADLRRRGFVVQCELGRKDGRIASTYQLLGSLGDPERGCGGFSGSPSEGDLHDRQSASRNEGAAAGPSTPFEAPPSLDSLSPRSGEPAPSDAAEALAQTGSPEQLAFEVAA